MTNESEIIFGVLFTTLIILLLIAAIVIITSYANRQRLKQEKKMTERELDYQKELRSAETEVREEIMSQVSRELHDNIGHMLTFMRLQLENKKLDAPALAELVAPVEQTLISVTDQVRLLSRSLNTDYITKLGLPGALELEARRLQQLPRPKVHFEQAAHDFELDDNQRLMAFRIFQEMINNTLKHARARNLYILLSQTDSFSLEVKDDGKGFAYNETINTAQASGLHNMQKRAQMAGLQLQVESSPGNGCRYMLSV